MREDFFGVRARGHNPVLERNKFFVAKRSQRLKPTFWVTFSSSTGTISVAQLRRFQKKITFLGHFFNDGVRGTLSTFADTDRERGPRDRPRTPLESREMKIAPSPCEFHFLHRFKGGAGAGRKVPADVQAGKMHRIFPRCSQGC